MDRLLHAVVIIALLCLVYVIFVVAPVILYTQAECLRKGYPKAYVTVGLERYCSTLDGAVTIQVIKP